MRVTFYVGAKGVRANLWNKVFGIDILPVLSSTPQRVEIPGKGVCEAYMLDVGALSRDNFSHLVNYLSQRFHVVPSDVESELMACGMPIPVGSDLIVPAIDLRFFI